MGLVKLHAIIGKDGRIGKLEVVSGHPLLIQSAMDAVKQWQYEPTRVKGKAVVVDTEIDVIFSLNESKN
jgi:protein TonB